MATGYTVVIVDEPPAGNPASSYDITIPGLSAYLSTKLAAAISGLTAPVVLTHHVDYSRPRNLVRHYWTVSSTV